MIFRVKFCIIPQYLNSTLLTNQLPRIINFFAISHDTDFANQDLKAAMEDGVTWRKTVQS